MKGLGRRAVALLALALFVSPAAWAQSPRPKAHMEACTVWRYSGARIGTRNDCNRPVSILFMAYGGNHVVEADVAPGGWFDSGADEPVGGYMFTVCPLGYVPSVRFALENQVAIEDSLYNCLPRDKPGV
jgi:hypothetical protein